jgi:aspartate dehydrogenase
VSADPAGGELRVALIGAGAIGAVVGRALAAGDLPGVRLVGVVHQDPVDPEGLPVRSLAAAIEAADLVVECAGQRALIETAPLVRAAGRDLLVVSVGALAHPEVLAALRTPGPGRVRLSTGALGGLDLLRAATRLAPLEAVRIVTTKLPATLVQPWMDQTQRDQLVRTRRPVELMRDSAARVCGAFPRSANVAAAVALAVGDWSLVEAVVVADPEAELTSHVITAHGPAGDYRFEIRNRPSAAVPATSAVVPHAVLRAIEDLSGHGEAFL